MNYRIQDKPKAAGFSLAEVLVGITILSGLMIMMTQVLGSTQRVWMSAKNKAEEYRAARIAIETISRRISQASLGSYWDYQLDTNGAPLNYQRNSDLHFVCGNSNTLLGGADYPSHSVFFMAPFGVATSGAAGATGGLERLNELINGWGYYITISDDMSRRPAFLANDTERYPARRRFRLMELRSPTDQLQIFQRLPGSVSGQPMIQTLTDQNALYSWFTTNLAMNSQPIAENVVALLIQPEVMDGVSSIASGENRIAVAPDFLWDTRKYQWDGGGEINEIMRHRLPGLLRISMIVTSEASWERLDMGSQNAIESGLQQRLGGGVSFKVSKNLDDDLAKLSSYLDENRMDYRVFSTSVPLKSTREVSIPPAATPP